MGTMSCNRRYCTSIMCNRYSHVYGYICNECFNELIKLGPETNIHDFMNSTKLKLINEQAALARFNVEFPYKC